MPPPPPGKQPPPRRGTGVAPAAGRPSQGAAAAKRPARAPSAKLIANTGPASGQEFVLEGDELVIGRAADNPVSIPDTSVSRKHALVRKTADGWAVSDLGSGNGSALRTGDGRSGPMTPHQRFSLVPGMVLQLGDCIIQVVDI